MIVFLTLCYVALLVLFIKLKIIKSSIGWKLSPLLFMLVCFFALIFPMQWGAPSGTVNVFRYVVEVMPNVSGEVIDLPSKPLEPMKKGEVLFQIDPRPYQSQVDRLEASLKEAQQKSLMLPADLESAKSSVARAEAAIVEAKQQVEVLRIELESEKAVLKKSESQLHLAEENFDRTKKLFSKQAVTQEQLDTAQRNLDSANANFEESKADFKQVQLSYGSQIGGINTVIVQATEFLRAAKSDETKAKLALESTINGQHTSVAQLMAELELAKLNLEWTTVRAPEDGYVIQLALRPGQRVTESSTRSWMAYIDQKRTRIVVWIQQYQLRHVKPGQPVQLEFKLYPGQTFSATVDNIVKMNAMGQLQATGLIQDTTKISHYQLEYGVILTLDNDSSIDVTQLPGGAVGTAAIFTNHSKITHIIRRIELHMKSWLNYIIP